MDKKVKLFEITSKIGSGSTPRGGSHIYLNKGTALIRSQNILDFSFSKKGLVYIDDKEAYKLDNVLIYENDILLNITGDSIARCCIVPKNILPARVNQHVSIIRCKNKFDSRYVLYYLQYLKPYLLQICRVGGTRNALTKKSISNLEINFQKDYEFLASVLSSLDKKIELNNKINKNLEAMAKTLYDYWFVQFDFPDANGNPYKSSGGKMVYSEELKREIPEGWGVKSLGEIALIEKGTLITEKTADLKGKYKVVSAGLDYSYVHSEYNRDKFTITISASGANAGFINFWREKFFACDCTTVNGKSITETFLILEFLKLRQNYIYKQARGSAQPHVYPKDIASLKMEIYPKNLIEKFGKVAINLNEQIAINQEQNQKLTQLRDWLLPMLMNGQVGVE